MPEHRTHVRWDDRTKDLFLERLKTHGGIVAAALRDIYQLPNNEKNQAPGVNVYYGIIKRDPEFAARVEQTLDEIRGEVEAEIHRRGVKGWDEPVYQKGERALDHDGSPASIRKYSDFLLIARARALMPEKYGNKTTVDVNHNISHQHLVLTLHPSDLLYLDEHERVTLHRYMTKIRNGKKREALGEAGDDVRPLPNPAKMIDITPEPAPSDTLDDDPVLSEILQ